MSVLRGAFPAATKDMKGHQGEKLLEQGRCPRAEEFCSVNSMDLIAVRSYFAGGETEAEGREVNIYHVNVS